MKANVKTLLNVQSTNPQARIYLKQAPPCWSLILSAFQVALCSFLSLHLHLFHSWKGHAFTSHLCVSVLVAAGVSAWMTVPLRGIWPPRLLASVCATPRTTSASCSMARTLHSATKLMWVLCTWTSGFFQKVGLFFSLDCVFLSERLPDSLVFGERLLSLQTGLAYRRHSLWTGEGGWRQLLCLVRVWISLARGLRWLSPQSWGAGALNVKCVILLVLIWVILEQFSPSVVHLRRVRDCG